MKRGRWRALARRKGDGLSSHFACAQYDVTSPIVGVADTSPEGGSEVCFFVFASMPSEQTCLQGFANDGIHKALAFLVKNAKNESFNA